MVILFSKKGNLPPCIEPVRAISDANTSLSGPSGMAPWVKFGKLREL